MAFLSKLKDIFYDKVEVDEEDEFEETDEPIKPIKETREEKPRVEEIRPVLEEKEEEVEEKEESFSERDLFRNEKPFTFTELEEEEDLPPRKSVLDLDKRDVRPSAPVVEDRSRYESPKVESPRIFKPTPIISPIYGILDKDYKKEEIREKTTTEKSPVVSATTTYDSVRRKAYGTLEDDLEDTLNSMNKLSSKEVEVAVDETPVDTADLEDASKTLAELNEKTQKIENLINRIEEASDELDRTMSIGELEDTAELENFETREEETIGAMEDDKTMTDATLEHDLFNLIDSMYDDKEE